MSKTLEDLKDDDALEEYIGERIKSAIKDRLASKDKSAEAAKEKAEKLAAELEAAKAEAEAAKAAGMTDLQKAQRDAEKAQKRADAAEAVAREAHAKLTQRAAHDAVRDTVLKVAPKARGIDNIVELLGSKVKPAEDGTGFVAQDGAPLDKLVGEWLAQPQHAACYLPAPPTTPGAPTGIPDRASGEPAWMKETNPAARIAAGLKAQPLPLIVERAAQE